MITERIKKIDSITESVARNFGLLPANQLFTPPASGQWSIAECLHHIMVSNETYFKVFDEIISGKYKQTIWQRISPFTTSIENNMLKTLGPDVKQKFKSPKLFLPSSPKRIPPTIVSDFSIHQEKLKNYFRKLEEEHYSKIIISSPAAGLITIHLPVALDILMIHEQRHIRQAEALLAKTGNAN